MTRPSFLVYWKPVQKIYVIKSEQLRVYPAMA
jgi:hypothetical protein